MALIVEKSSAESSSNSRGTPAVSAPTAAAATAAAAAAAATTVKAQHHSQTRCLRAEFDENEDGPIPVIHYQHKGEWYAKVGLTGSPQKLNMRGIQEHGRKWRVQKRTRGHLRKWTYNSLPEAQRKRDKLLG